MDEHHPPGPPHRHRLDPLTPAAHPRRRKMKEHGHVRSERRPDSRQLAPIVSHPPHGIEKPQHRGRVAAPAAHAASDRNPLVQPQAQRRRIDPFPPGEPLDRPPRQVVFPGQFRHVASHGRGSRRTRSERDRVVQAHPDHHRLQFVIAVGAFAEDGEGEVDLGRGPTGTRSKGRGRGRGTFSFQALRQHSSRWAFAGTRPAAGFGPGGPWITGCRMRGPTTARRTCRPDRTARGKRAQALPYLLPRRV